jgi:hypothetical protein
MHTSGTHIWWLNISIKNDQLRPRWVRFYRMSLVPSVPRFDMKVEKPEQTATTQVAFMSGNPEQDTDESSVGGSNSRTGSPSIHDSDEADHQPNTSTTELLFESSVLDPLPQVSEGSSPRSTTDVITPAEDHNQSCICDALKTSVSQEQEVIKGRISPTGQDLTAEENRSKRNSQKSHFHPTLSNISRNDFVSQLDKVKKHLKHAPMEGKTTEREVSFAWILQFRLGRKSY